MPFGEKTVYYCDSCGGIMAFDTKTQSLKCPNCGNQKEIIDEKTTKEHDIEEYKPTSVSPDDKTTKTMECNGCGAHIEIDQATTALTCPYCGSNIILAAKQLAAIIPDGIRPFQIDKKQVGVIFRKWISGRWLAPNELKNLYQQDKVMGIYLPYWTFDAKMESSYTAMGGRDRRVAYTDSEGKTKYRTETDWYHTSGFVSGFFDDVLIRASITLQGDLMRNIGDFDTKRLVSYSPAYVSGYASEVYTVTFTEARSYAKDEMNYRTQRMIEQDVLRKYDRVRNINMNPLYSDETYKHVLLPVYSTAFGYKGKSYNVLINGETGSISGDYPKSIIKITLLILLAIVILAVVYYFSQRAESGSFSYDFLNNLATSMSFMV